MHFIALVARFKTWTTIASRSHLYKCTTGWKLFTIVGHFARSDCAVEGMVDILDLCEAAVFCSGVANNHVNFEPHLCIVLTLCFVARAICQSM